MEKISLKDKYCDFFKELASLSHAAAKIDETNVYQKANPATRKFMDELLDELLQPGSDLKNKEHFKTFYEEVTVNKKRGLILMEHYTNLDLPIICYLLEHQNEEWANDFSKRIVAIAGMKLNEESPIVRAWAEGFTRVVIYPSRSLNKLDNMTEEEKKSYWNSSSSWVLCSDS